MNNPIFDKISPFLSLGMLTIFLLFILIGALFGLGRGLKRASLRLIIFVGALIVAFFVTPLIVNGTLHTNLRIAGYTPNEFINYASDEMVKFLQQNMGDYIVPFQDYIKDYALGMVLAILNIAVFYALYFIIKFIGWIIYAIVAAFAAPKKTRDGKRVKKYAGWGALVGAVQGLLLFVFFLFPVNGLVGMVNQAAEYQAKANSANMTASATVDSETSTNSPMADILEKVDGPLQGYNAFMKYSGIQFLSTKALEYQMTIRVDDKQDINLVHDINSGFELYIDSAQVMKVMNKLQNAYSKGYLDLTDLNANDYKTLRAFVDKAFGLEILNVADQLLHDMDQILMTPFNEENKTVLVTLQDGDKQRVIYENSFYGMMIKNGATTKIKAGEDLTTNYTKYASGLTSVVGYIGEQGLDLVHQDLINMIDFVEVLDIYQVTYDTLPAGETTTLTKAVAKSGLGAKDYLTFSTARINEDYGKYARGTNLIDVLGMRLNNFKAIQTVGCHDAENLLLYGKMMDSVATGDAATKDLIEGLVPYFVGDKALSTYNADGSKKSTGYWEVLGRDLVDVAQVLRNYADFTTQIEAKKVELQDKGYSESRLQLQAILSYLSDFVIDEEYYNAHKDDAQFAGYSEYKDAKYQKIDELVDKLYKLIEDFPPVKTFVITKMESMTTDAEGDYMTSLVEKLRNGTKQELKDTLHSIVNVANVINNSKLGDLIDKVQNIDPENPETLANLAQDLINSANELNAADVENMIDSVLSVPTIGDSVESSLKTILDDFGENDDEKKTKVNDMLTNNGEELSETQVNEIVEQIDKVQSILNHTNTNQDETLAGEVGDLWSLFKQYQSKTSTNPGA